LTFHFHVKNRKKMRTERSISWCHKR
jgi:hypothetical protein